MKKKLIIGGLALLLLIGLYLFFKPKAVVYLTETPKYRNLMERVIAKGKIDASQVVDVGAQVSGQLKKLYVNLGDSVKKGDLLAELDAEDKENNLKSAEFEVVNLEAQLAAKEAKARQLRANLGRSKKLFTKGDIAKADLEMEETDLEVANKEISALKAQIVKSKIAVSSAKIDLGYTKILAPIDGIVSSIVTKEGQTVVSTQQAVTILVLKNLSKVTVKAEIAEADVGRVKPGMKLYFTILGDAETKHHGVLRAIEPDTKINTKISDQLASTNDMDEAVYYNGLFEVENREGIFYPFMTAEVSIIVEEAEKALSIPLTAISEKEGQEYVYVLRKGKVHTQLIKTGVSNRIYIEVKEGLDEKEQVVLGNSTETTETNAFKRRRAF